MWPLRVFSWRSRDPPSGHHLRTEAAAMLGAMTTEAFAVFTKTRAER